MKTPYDVIKTILTTEKSVSMGNNKYVFAVDINANKLQIGRAVEEIYKVKVRDINTMIMHGKKKRVRYAFGKRPDWKKAVVSLKEGTIEVK
jgi:large subunit ribosomal protein L23